MFLFVCLFCFVSWLQTRVLARNPHFWDEFRGRKKLEPRNFLYLFGVETKYLDEHPRTFQAFWAQPLAKVSPLNPGPWRSHAVGPGQDWQNGTVFAKSCCLSVLPCCQSWSVQSYEHGANSFRWLGSSKFDEETDFLRKQRCQSREHPFNESGPQCCKRHHNLWTKFVLATGGLITPAGWIPLCWLSSRKSHSKPGSIGWVTFFRTAKIFRQKFVTCASVS